MCLNEYVHFADYAFDGEMLDTETLELGALFETQFLGGTYNIANGYIIFIEAE